MEKSEFGKGLVICLVKFSEHFENSKFQNVRQYARFLEFTEEQQNKIRSSTPPDNLNYGSVNKSFDWWMNKIVPIWGTPEKTLSHEIEICFSGASDHLYGIEVPKDTSWDNIRKEIKRLQNKGLEMGHGFHNKRMWKIEDMNELVDSTRKISLMIDKKIGLKPQEGPY